MNFISNEEVIELINEFKDDKKYLCEFFIDLMMIDKNGANESKLYSLLNEKFPEYVELLDKILLLK